MTEIIAKIKNISLITIIASIVIGAILIISPQSAMGFVAIAFGVTLILLGVAALIDFIAKSKSTLMAVLGTVSIVAGIIICARYKAIIAIFLTLFGVFLIISGILDLISSLTVKAVFSIGWLFSLLLAIAIIVLGIIIVVNPFESAVLGARILGIALFVYAVLDIILFIQVRRTVALKKVSDKNITEIDVSADDIE